MKQNVTSQQLSAMASILLLLVRNRPDLEEPIQRARQQFADEGLLQAAMFLDAFTSGPCDSDDLLLP
jgi:hypothetical protein